ncbi:MAG: recombinase family protein [Pseudohongiella sp.]|nr:recombinase family protein [Pseudohongiella sp.]
MAKQHLVGYARVSSEGQSTENQIERLEQYGCDKIFFENYSGANTDREQFNAIMDYVREGDAFVVTKLDRLARSAMDLGKTAEILQQKNVDLVVLDQDIDTTTPTGKLMFTMIGAFAEFERDLIRERCREGIERAKAKGIKFGRRAKLSSKQLATMKEEYHSGDFGRSDLAAKYGISKSSLYRLVNS